MQLLEALASYELQLQADGRSPITVFQYHSCVTLLDRWLEVTHRSRDLASITHETLARYLAERCSRRLRDGMPKKVRSVNSARLILRRFFGYCADAGLCRESPARLIRMARSRPPPPRAVPQEDVDRLFGFLDRQTGWIAQRDRLMYLLMLRAGLRLGSVVGMNVEDVDLERRQIFLRTMKNDRPALLPIGPSLAEELAEFIEGRAPGPLFNSQRSERICTRLVHCQIARWWRLAGCSQRITPHRLRHTFAIDLLAKTGNILLVLDALCHASLDATEQYLRLPDGALRRALGE